MTRAKKVEPEAPRETIQITIDKAEFIKTRDAVSLPCASTVNTPVASPECIRYACLMDCAIIL